LGYSGSFYELRNEQQIRKWKIIEKQTQTGNAGDVINAKTP
jgi:hypothetical protein